MRTCKIPLGLESAIDGPGGNGTTNPTRCRCFPAANTTAGDKFTYDPGRCSVCRGLAAHSAYTQSQVGK
jgi:hypothetical protein